MEPANQDVLASTPRAVTGLDIRPAGTDVLVHDAATGKVHLLNAMGGRVLAACDGGTTVREIADAIVRATGADRAVVEHDVAAACDDFRSQGLIG
jgi:hypothetical protein